MKKLKEEKVGKKKGRTGGRSKPQNCNKVAGLLFLLLAILKNKV